MNFSRILILSGLLFMLFGGNLVYQRYSPKKLEFKDLAVNQSVVTEVKPVKIIVPSLNIENVIYSSKIENNKWEATTKGISYLSTSPVPGQNGNSILYGHNWPSLLGNLSSIKPGDTIIITSDHGKKLVFEVEYTSVVTPDDVSVLSQTKDKRITLYTCIGFLDSHRFVVVAILKE
jgi:LPXTG-site transpeptidase (sortase) family protein